MASCSVPSGTLGGYDSSYTCTSVQVQLSLFQCWPSHAFECLSNWMFLSIKGLSVPTPTLLALTPRDPLGPGSSLRPLTH